MARILTYKVSSKDDIKISAYLKERGYSSHLLTILRGREDSISLNGEYLHMNAYAKNGDIITVRLPKEESNEKIEAVNIDITIIYEDEDILIIDKPSHMPIHPSIEHHDDTLANALAYYFSSKNEDFVYRCMTRLDRDTSGLVLIAKNILSATILSDMVKRGEIKKEYIALVAGITDESGTINAPIARKDGSLVERVISKDGQDAITHFVREKAKILTDDNSFAISKLRLWLETGRTHQIRVHMKHIGHPLLGDFMYNPLDKHMPRQALHCEKMSFYHPITGQSLSFKAAIPCDFIL